MKQSRIALAAISASGVLALGACSSDPSASDGDTSNAYLEAGDTTTIVSAIGGKCLDDSGDLTADENKIQIWDCNSTSAQKWTYDANHQLVGPGGKCLDIQWDNQTAGTPVWLYTCNSSTAQRWTVVGKQIQSTAGLCLDVRDGVNADGTQVQLAKCADNTASQEWTVGGSSGTTTPPPTPQPTPDSVISSANPVVLDNPPAQYVFSTHLLVDQFGYRPGDDKVAVINNTTSPGTYYLRKASDGTVVYQAQSTTWNNGATDVNSGDRGSWFDFSSVTTPGTYFVSDGGNNRSARFVIAKDAYKNVLKGATKMFFYQRAAQSKQMPYVDACWVDKPGFVGPNQDTEARDIQNPNGPGKDVSGGWYDAGDTNKYVQNANGPVHDLLAAYRENASVFGDDFGIPESGNGIPDVLDEVNFELAWVKRMQDVNADGSVALKVGAIDYGQANEAVTSTTNLARYYVKSCTTSTIAAASMFAHAAYVFKQFPSLASEANDLQARAVRAWTNFNATPIQLNCDVPNSAGQQVIVPGADRSAALQRSWKMATAAYLYALTGDAQYDGYVASSYQSNDNNAVLAWPSGDSDVTREALLFYATLPGASVPKSTMLSFVKKYTVARNANIGWSNTNSLYRSYFDDYDGWGSNETRATDGAYNQDMTRFLGGDAGNQMHALGIVHYFHGVNPFGWTYLSNMKEYGATLSVSQLFGWAYSSSATPSTGNYSDPNPRCNSDPPGYIPGGPDTAYGFKTPPDKAYANDNTLNAPWAYAEPAIYYQAAFIKLLSNFGSEP